MDTARLTTLPWPIWVIFAHSLQTIACIWHMWSSSAAAATPALYTYLDGGWGMHVGGLGDADPPAVPNRGNEHLVADGRPNNDH